MVIATCAPLVMWYAVRMPATQTLQDEARTLIRDADFVKAWPAEVKAVLAKTLQTEGEVPAYAVREVQRALAEARRIERKCAKDIEQGEKTLSHAEKRRLAGAK